MYPFLMLSDRYRVSDKKGFLCWGWDPFSKLACINQKTPMFGCFVVTEFSSEFLLKPCKCIRNNISTLSSLGFALAQDWDCTGCPHGWPPKTCGSRQISLLFFLNLTAVFDLPPCKYCDKGDCLTMAFVLLPRSGTTGGHCTGRVVTSAHLNVVCRKEKFSSKCCLISTCALSSRLSRGLGVGCHPYANDTQLYLLMGIWLDSFLDVLDRLLQSLSGQLQQNKKTESNGDGRQRSCS